MTIQPAYTDQPGTTGPIVDQLIALLGAESVETAQDKRVFFSTDIARSGGLPLAVIRPTDRDMLAGAVKLLASSGIAMVPRGGGFSYTGGYVPDDAGSVIVDLRGLDRIVEINAADMYVVVEVGCTWRTLYETLKARGLRTPYFGPMSGYNATVGGALSQGSFFLGSSQYGPVADSVLGIEMVIGDGSVVRTGSWGNQQEASPFFRSYGPDLTGLFLGDAGALGFKAAVALKLIPFPDHQAFASFAFAEEADATVAVSAIARTGLAAECYCWDPYFVQIMAGVTTGLADELKLLAGVARGGGSFARGLFTATRVALAGKRTFGHAVFMLNLTVDDVSAAGADARLAVLRKLAGDAGGREIAPTAPAAMRGTPFMNFNTPERRAPLRSLPTHGLVPHSRVPALCRDIRALFAEHQAALKEHAIEIGVIYFGVGAQAVCVEPVFYWEDLLHFHHDRVAERSDVKGIEAFGGTPEATRLVGAVRQDLLALFERHGSAHVQIGRSYPWLRTRTAGAAALLQTLKAAVDPRHVVNPGALGL